MKAGIKDLKMELWLRRRDEGLIKWTTRDGKEIPIKDMTITHLQNTVKMLEREEIDWDTYLDALGGDWEG